jgi:16S rRNA (cytosine1402-N4)-methyltransferase
MPNIRVLGIDRDPEALDQAQRYLQIFGERVILREGSYADLDHHLRAADFPAAVDGILLDLGVNSHQLDASKRGFSFLHDGPLDMRFHQGDSDSLTASELVNLLPLEDLVQIFRDWGEEPHAKLAAKSIVQWRQHQPFEHTSELRDCLHRALGWRKQRQRTHLDPATLCFQALRIAVNREFDHLERFLAQFPSWLASGGHIAIISFHSLEDRLVKHRLREYSKSCLCPADWPICTCGTSPKLQILTKRPITPNAQEIENNSRSRSAKLRAAMRLNSLI